MTNDRAEIRQLVKFMQIFNSETERGAALLAASILEDRLFEILKSYLRDHKISEDLLTGFNAPLGTFSARSKAAFALGLIEKKEYEEITLIRKIRNEFGHNWENVTFDSEKISSYCGQLDWRGPADPEIKRSARATFNFSIALLLTDLMWRTILVKQKQIQPTIWPNKTRYVNDV